MAPSSARASVVAYTSQAAFTAAASGTAPFAVTEPAGAYGSSYTLGPATFSATTVNIFDDGSFGAGVSYLAFYPSRAFATFSAPIYAIGLTLGTYGGAGTIDVSLNAVPVTTVVTPGAYPDTFYLGFTDSDPITSLALFDRTTSREIDLVSFDVFGSPGGSPGGITPLPEPGTLPILGLALLTAFILRRRTIA